MSDVEAAVEPLELVVGELDPQATAIVTALRAFDDAELRMRSRFRRLLGVGTTDLAALRFIRSRERLGSPARGTDLRQRLGVSSATATTITNRLTVAGFIEKPRDPVDGRARVLRLTPDARARIDLVVADTEARLDAVLTSITPEEALRIVQLVEAATKVVEDAGRPDPGHG
ncbi:MAG TPA: MarR family transcriptional regulator [Amnibacterium sp.]|jgi:DNA-binding MarR family transcriptional regulator